MKLLLDENPSDRIASENGESFPGSSHLKTHGLVHVDDSMIWESAKANGFTAVSKDPDFHRRGLVLGHSPKVVFLRLGNCLDQRVGSLLRGSLETLRAFGFRETAGIPVFPVPPVVF